VSNGSAASCTGESQEGGSHASSTAETNSLRIPWDPQPAGNPLAKVQVESERSIYQAREASQAEVDHYWPQLVQVWPPYQTFYERSGQRVIFLLEPLPSSRAATV